LCISDGRYDTVPLPNCQPQSGGAIAFPAKLAILRPTSQHGHLPRPFPIGTFLNRELSWLEFNQRVLDEALNPATPLLERLKFFCIASSNLDEFFEVRVAGVKQQIESEVVERSVDGRTATETFRAVTKRVRQMVDQQYRCWRDELVPELARNGIRFLDPAELDATPDRAWLDNYYRLEVRPVLTPLAIDPAHPFPAVAQQVAQHDRPARDAREGRALRHLGVVQVPRVLPRLVRLPREDGTAGVCVPRPLDRFAPGGSVPRDRDPRVLALPRDPQQRALHRRGGCRQPA
jgi:polyphosphate kinase